LVIHYGLVYDDYVLTFLMFKWYQCVLFCAAYVPDHVHIRRIVSWIGFTKPGSWESLALNLKSAGNHQLTHSRSTAQAGPDRM